MKKSQSVEKQAQYATVCVRREEINICPYWPVYDRNLWNDKDMNNTDLLGEGGDFSLHTFLYIWIFKPC